MRVLDFTWLPGGQVGDQAKTTYELLYDGLLNSLRALEAPSETRIVGKIQDKLEAIGQLTERPQGTVNFTLNPYLSNEYYRVTLEEGEYKLMGECLKTVKWAARAARQVTVALDFYEQAPEV